MLMAIDSFHFHPGFAQKGTTVNKRNGEDHFSIDINVVQKPVLNIHQKWQL